MRLHDLSPAEGARKGRKRLGRGVGSGHGKTAGKGSKGQKSRSGGGVRPGFEGGQMPIQRRLPKRGFTNIFKKNIAIVNISDLAIKFRENDVVDEIALKKTGLIKGRVDGVKLLGEGDISFSLSVRLTDISKSAREKIESAGGNVEIYNRGQL